jgi:hypothetical protein
LTIEPTISVDGVVTLVFVRHTLRRVNPTIGIEVRVVAQDVTQLSPGCVDLATTTRELIVQFTPQLEQPAIMVMGCASPDGAGMVEVSDLVDIISPHAASEAMSSGHKLCVLDDHLGAVLVTVVLGTFLWITIKEKDVHAYIVAEDHTNGKEKNSLLERLQANPRKNTLFSRFMYEGGVLQ